nr:UDP-glucose 6-dehydrogenase [Leptinotarsa decemlineata]
MTKITNICCLGAGYVGGPTCSVIALKCPEIKVTVADLSKERIAQWNSEKLPIYEVKFELPQVIPFAVIPLNRQPLAYIEFCFGQGPSSIGRGPKAYFFNILGTMSQITFLKFVLVSSSQRPLRNVIQPAFGRAADLKYVEGAARRIAEIAQSDKIVVEKSTVPVRAAESVAKILIANQKPGVKYQVLSNPEFLAEGTAINDLLNADRVLIGGEESTGGKLAIEALCNVYEHWIPRKNILTTNTWSSELSKLFPNTVLHLVRYLLQFFFLGIERYDLSENVQNHLNNSTQIQARNSTMVLMINIDIFQVEENQIFEDLTHPSVCESPERVRKNVTIHRDAYSACEGCHAIVVCTEWDEFIDLDYQKIYQKMMKPAYVFDGRKILNHQDLKAIGYHVHTIGKRL